MTKSVEHFGSFLVRADMISVEQLLGALDARASVQKPLGRVFLEMGTLSVKDIFKIVDWQVDNPGRFGEIAVQLGMCTESDVHQALCTQHKSRPTLGELLVAGGALSVEQLAAANLGYRQSLTTQRAAS